MIGLVIARPVRLGALMMARMMTGVLAGLLACAPALADVFVWKDPQTGRTRMSNIAPPWLREPVPGRRNPKVEVVRDNKVIDPSTAFATPQRAPEPPPAAANAAAKGGVGIPAAPIDDD